LLLKKCYKKTKAEFRAAEEETGKKNEQFWLEWHASLVDEMIREAITMPTLQLMGLPQSGIHIPHCKHDTGAVLHIDNHSPGANSPMIHALSFYGSHFTFIHDPLFQSVRSSDSICWLVGSSCRPSQWVQKMRACIASL
jgi:hypothetical protein